MTSRFSSLEPMILTSAPLSEEDASTAFLPLGKDFPCRRKDL